MKKRSNLMNLVLVTLLSLVACSSCSKKEINIQLGCTSKTSILTQPGYYVWGASAIKGDDGLYHVFYSRWKKEYSFNAWVTHSEIAHAVSPTLLGPYKFKNVALPARGATYWDGYCTHNPTIHKFGNKYYLYYMGNTGDGQNIKNDLNWNHRNNQRIGVAVATDLNGVWERFDKPLIDVSSDDNAPDALCTNNPAITQMPNGKFLMIYKCVGKKRGLPFGGPVAHLAAFSDSPSGPFTKNLTPLFTSDKSDFPAEDPYIWTQGDKVYAIVKDIKGVFTGTGDYSLALFETTDGLNWKTAKNSLVTERLIKWDDGSLQKVANLERPQLYQEDGEPKALFFAVNPSDFSHTYNVHIPLKCK